MLVTSSTGALNLSKRKRSQRDLEPKLSNVSPNSDNEVSTSENNPHYYTLSHFESVNYFFIHTSCCTKELAVIESEIETEFENGTELNVENPQLNEIYGFYCGQKNQYFRVRVINFLPGDNDPDELVFEVFFMDYGHKQIVYAHSLFLVPDEIKQNAPQAICCKLNGFQNEKPQKIQENGMLFFHKKIGTI